MNVLAVAYNLAALFILVVPPAYMLIAGGARRRG